MLTRISADGQQAPRRGTTALEYLMMLSLIIVVALVGIGYFGSSTNNMTTSASNAITNSVNNAKK